MSPIGHAAAAFPAKRLAPSIPLPLLIVATSGIDLLYGAFSVLGLDGPGYAFWSHSLVMSLLWSALAGLIAFGVTRKARIGMVMAGTFWSHWAFDFLVWNTLPLFRENPGHLGLGLWAAVGFSTEMAGWNTPSIIATAMDLSFLAAGIAFYAITGKAPGGPAKKEEQAS